MYTLKIHKIGDSLGITLSEEVLQQLNVGEGDNVFVTKTAEGIQIGSMSGLHINPLPSPPAPLPSLERGARFPVPLLPKLGEGVRGC